MIHQITATLRIRTEAQLYQNKMRITEEEKMKRKRTNNDEINRKKLKRNKQKETQMK